MTPAEALQALAQVLAPLVARELSAKGSRPYSQVDGERPPGTSKLVYLRAWRAARRQGHPGATSDGRARLLTPEAFAAGRAVMRPPKKAAPELDIDDKVLKKLGLSRPSAA